MSQASVDYVLENWVENGGALQTAVVATLSGGNFSKAVTAVHWPGGGAQPEEVDDIANFLPL